MYLCPPPTIGLCHVTVSSQIAGIDDDLLMRKNRRRNIAALAISLLIAVVGFAGCFEYSGEPMDEGALLVYPELVQNGAVPYRDFETFYGPANPWLLAGIYSLLGNNVTVERGTGLFYRLLIMAAIFCLAQRRGTNVALACTLLSGLTLILTRVVAYAWMGAMVCALWYLWVLTRRDLSSRGAFLAGMLGGLALLFRVDLGPALILATLPLFVAISWRQRWMVMGGAAVALAPLAGVAVMAGADQMLNNLFVYPVLRSNPGRHIPISAIEPFLRHLLWLHFAAVAVNVAAGLCCAWGNWGDRRKLAMLSVSLLSLGVTHQALQRLDVFHLLLAAFLSIGILPLAVSILTARMAATKKREGIAAFACAAVVVVSVSALAPAFPPIIARAFADGARLNSSGAIFVEKNGRSFPVGDEITARALDEMLNQLEQHSEAGQRLFVGPADLRTTFYCDTFIYHLVPKLRPATYFLEMNPFSANRPDSRLADDVASADWLVLNLAWNTPESFNRSGDKGSNAPNVVAQENFVLVGIYDTYGLFRRKR